MMVSEAGEDPTLTHNVEHGSQQIVAERISVSGKFPMARGKAGVDDSPGAGKPGVVS
jgi:hypothetical protein